MTPREGVERICDESAAWWRAKAEDPSLPHDVRMFAIARASGAMEVKDALPAATAREEAWKAMVEALTYIASHRGLTLLGDGSYSDGVRDGWIELADAADRALALARSTGAES